jgi:hypothetical protein
VRFERFEQGEGTAAGFVRPRSPTLDAAGGSPVLVVEASSIAHVSLEDHSAMPNEHARKSFGL